MRVTAQVERRPATSAHGSTLGSYSVQSTPSSATRLIRLRLDLDRQLGSDQQRQEAVPLDASRSPTLRVSDRTSPTRPAARRAPIHGRPARRALRDGSARIPIDLDALVVPGGSSHQPQSPARVELLALEGGDRLGSSNPNGVDANARAARPCVPGSRASAR